MTIKFHLEDYEDTKPVSEHFHREIKKIDGGGGVVALETKKMSELTLGRLDYSKFHKPDYPS
jgi:hypothetical protein